VLVTFFEGIISGSTYPGCEPQQLCNKDKTWLESEKNMVADHNNYNLGNSSKSVSTKKQIQNQSKLIQNLKIPAAHCNFIIIHHYSACTMSVRSSATYKCIILCRFAAENLSS